MERRRDNRLFIEVPGTYREAGGRAHEIVFDAISAGGCRLNRVEPHLGVGNAIELNLGPIGPLTARICWRRGDAAGVAFAEALDPLIVTFFAAFCGAAA